MPDVLSVAKCAQTERNLLFKQCDEYTSFKSARQSGNSEKKLSVLQVCGYSAVLEDVIQSIQILGAIGCNPSVPIDTDYKTIDEEYGPSKLEKNIFVTPSTETAHLKFYKDMAYVNKILTELNQELTTSMEMTNFLVTLQKYKQSEDDCRGLLEEAKLNRERLSKLQHLLATSKFRMRKKLHAKCQEVEKIATKYEDMIYENEIKENYLESWEDSRSYQNNFLAGRKERKLQEAINSTLADTKDEMRVHWETEYFEKTLQNEYTALIETWTGNYNRDLENNDMAIQEVKQKRTEQLEALDDLLNEYNKREQEMKDYVKERDIRLKEEEEMRKMNAAAVKIQAWWRRVMYRLHLGPYRKKSKKKKKK